MSMPSKLHINVHVYYIFMSIIHMYHNPVSYLAPPLTPLVLHGISECRVYGIVKLL